MAMSPIGVFAKGDDGALGVEHAYRWKNQYHAPPATVVTVEPVGPVSVSEAFIRRRILRGVRS
ncbi:MAG: hypothetical protein F4029_07720 [Gammaproteobacteria bacterium]|nr:hypothetical protein [Gammaproteobacteria bacterium]MXY54959.1 hypothetical protein [Gammaproteobacteria bacterium]MYF27355.1 hypothetical protein [Gammaproteobacteria bacterium]MYK46101.1 hypothetical protein [Gammaproteobacteria bacterium]